MSRRDEYDAWARRMTGDEEPSRPGWQAFALLVALFGFALLIYGFAK
jgi:hypothetical protein